MWLWLRGCIVVAVGLVPTPAVAQHTCDALGERGWHVVPTVETVAQRESPPREDAAGGTWYVERATTRLPMCNYYNAVGNYSLRSYALAPETSVERIVICRPDDRATHPGDAHPGGERGGARGSAGSQEDGGPQQAGSVVRDSVAIAPYAGPCPPQPSPRLSQSNTP